MNLHYNKGELIIKEGDYGIAIYKVVKGAIQLFTNSEDREITLSLLGPGEIFGELTFFSKNISTRPTSARAVEDSEVEAWHSASLSKAYDEMPPIIKHITYGLLNRRIRMNKLMTQMSPFDEESAEKSKIDRDDQTSGRLCYRKEVSLPCTYRPVESSVKLRLNGLIRDISISGANMEVRRTNATRISHDPGEEFYLDITLPNGKEIHLTSKIVSSRTPRSSGMPSFGTVFTDMREGSRKELGFFLV